VFLKDLLNLNNREKRGFFILICLIFILLGIRFFILYRNNKSDKIHNNEISLEFLRWIDSINNNNLDTIYNRKAYTNLKPINKIDFSKIDINKVSDSIIFKLNLPQKLKKSWINYRKSGGIFYSIEDFKKLYGINDSIFDFLKPYLYVNLGNLDNKKYNNAQKYELNGVSKYFLLKCINNEIIVNKIISYKKDLGGFFDFSQLYEIEGINNIIIDKLKENFFIDTMKVKKINLKKASLYQLSKHPYIGMNNAKKIINFREFNNNNIIYYDLIKYKLLNDTILKKLRPYVD